MIRTLALCAALALPVLAGGCSMMNDGASASTVSRDSQGAGAISGAVTPQGGATVGSPGDKNPAPKS
jgi:hypothetical protein